MCPVWISQELSMEYVTSSWHLALSCTIMRKFQVNWCCQRNIDWIRDGRVGEVAKDKNSFQLSCSASRGWAPPGLDTMRAGGRNSCPTKLILKGSRVPSESRTSLKEQLLGTTGSKA